MAEPLPFDSRRAVQKRLAPFDQTGAGAFLLIACSLREEAA